MFFRDGQMFERRRGLYVQEKDVLAVLADTNQVDDIDHILGSREPHERLTDRRFFGEFTVIGQALLGDIKNVYGLDIQSLDPELSQAECFAQMKRGHSVVGDRIDLGSMLMVAREVEGDVVTSVGLKLSR
jgi:cell volume regulation protein A